MKIYLSTDEEKLILMTENYTFKHGEKNKVGQVLNIVSDDIEGDIDIAERDETHKYKIDEKIGNEKIIVKKVTERKIRLR